MGANPSQLQAPDHQATNKYIEIWDDDTTTNQAAAVPLNKNSLEPIKLPHNHENIIKEADSPIDQSSTEKLLDLLYTGVFLDQKRKKYWVEKNSGLNCFMLYARNLSITWGEDQRYWRWHREVDIATSEEVVEVAELVTVCWLEVQGKFEMSNLSPETMYEVVLVMKLKDPAYGWEVPVNLKLVLPKNNSNNNNGEIIIQERKEDLMRKPRADWIELHIGKFMTSSPANNKGELNFSLFEYEGGAWKKGLVVKGVVIRPKTS